jgi:hypothetical protein
MRFNRKIAQTPRLARAPEPRFRNRRTARRADHLFAARMGFAHAGL